MSAPRDDEIYLGHIRDAIARVQSYVRDVSEEVFLATPLIQDAVIRQIQIIGEASSRLSPTFRSSHPSIPWKDVIGMRGKLVHDYMGIDLVAVWDTATIDVVRLKTELASVGDSTQGPNSA